MRVCVRTAASLTDGQSLKPCLNAYCLPRCGHVGNEPTMGGEKGGSRQPSLFVRILPGVVLLASFPHPLPNQPGVNKVD